MRWLPLNQHSECSIHTMLEADSASSSVKGILSLLLKVVILLSFLHSTELIRPIGFLILLFVRFYSQQELPLKMASYNTYYMDLPSKRKQINHQKYVLI